MVDVSIVAFHVLFNVFCPEPPTAVTAELLDVPEPVVYVRRQPTSRRLRGDWEPPDLVALAYTSSWHDAVVAIIAAASRTARVAVLLEKGITPEDAAEWLELDAAARAAVEIIPAGVDTPWIRDYGPLETVDRAGRRIWLDATYDGARPNDDAMPGGFAKRYRMPVESLPEQLEGGALISNGARLCASTLEAFQSSQINVADPEGLDPLLEQLGCHVLALLPALEHDKTKHADMFAQFLAPNVAVVAEIDPSVAPEDAVRLDRAVAGLRLAAQMSGVDLEIVRVPMTLGPDDEYYTYINGLNLGSTFLVPQYEAVDHDFELGVYSILGQAMPGLELLPVPADAMIELNGAVHCITVGLGDKPLVVARMPRRVPPDGPRAVLGRAEAGMPASILPALPFASGSPSGPLLP